MHTSGAVSFLLTAGTEQIHIGLSLLLHLTLFRSPSESDLEKLFCVIQLVGT
jgi:hypothetical protein